MDTLAAGALVAFAVALVTTPAGVSGAVLLLPVQVSVLDVPSPAVTPTNLVYNVVATPGALVRMWRHGRLRGPLAATLVAGTLPGVVAGAVLRVELLAGDDAFLLVVAAVLLPLGVWLATVGGRPPAAGRRRPPPGRVPLVGLSLGVGVVGGIYGVGGGSILAPVLVALGLSVYEVAGAALAATLVTSLAGIATFEVLAATHAGGGAISPDLGLGLAMGAGGFAGAYAGARLQPALPEALIRRVLGVVVVLVALRYVASAIA